MELESAAFLPPSMMGELAPAACPTPLCAGLVQLLNVCSHRIYSSNPFYAFPVPIVFMVALPLAAECRLPALVTCWTDSLQHRTAMELLVLGGSVLVWLLDAAGYWQLPEQFVAGRSIHGSLVHQG